MIAGNKHDMEDQRDISRQEIQSFCESLDCDYVEISVRENKGIDELLAKVVEHGIVNDQGAESKG